MYCISVIGNSENSPYVSAERSHHLSGFFQRTKRRVWSKQPPAGPKVLVCHDGNTVAIPLATPAIIGALARQGVPKSKGLGMFGNHKTTKNMLAVVQLCLDQILLQPLLSSPMSKMPQIVLSQVSATNIPTRNPSFWDIGPVLCWSSNNFARCSRSVGTRAPKRQLIAMSPHSNHKRGRDVIIDKFLIETGAL